MRYIGSDEKPSLSEDAFCVHIFIAFLRLWLRRLSPDYFERLRSPQPPYAPAFFAAVGALEVSSGDGVGGVNIFRNGGDKFVPAFSAFVFACVKLQRNCTGNTAYYNDDSPKNIRGAEAYGIKGYIFDGDVERLRGYLEKELEE